MQTNAGLVIEFEFLITAACGSPTCSFATAEELSNQVYADATGALKTALQDGSFINDLSQSDIDGIQDILAGASASVDFEELIVPLMQRYPSSSPTSLPSCTPSASPTESPTSKDIGVKLFYPNWKFGDQGCR